ncbi:AAA family ATPase [Actinacidiphila sp. DG2A-62]|uniref:AAA family ATPase n=1 Tax=Actinacidiphila sp. DG2A-62 TaxID=3108821 RepID=UPI002DB8AD8E|nr:AAA family ATPase [Actinacidiphila sp. DG2A-62]MEC3993807.1 AAA family ATPase [Actinacidiphila sp. DG2A-62]
MSQHRPTLVGRDDEVSAVVETLSGVGHARTLVLTGVAGVGRTAVLKEACRIASDSGAKVMRLAWESAEGEPGVPALVHAVCRVLARIRDGRLPVRITEIRRAELRTAGRDGDLTVLSTMSRMLADAAHYVPFALVVDDCERMPAPTASALGLMLRAFRPAGLPVVMAHGSQAPGHGGPDAPGHPGSEAPGHPGAELLAAADRVLDLAPLTEDDVPALVEQWLGRPAEPEVAQAVMRSLGPLAGNPQALLSVLGALVEDAGLLELDGRVLLVSAQDALRLRGTVAEACRVAYPGLPLEEEVLARTVVFAHLAGVADFRLTDVQDMGQWTPGKAVTVAQILDRLVTRRVLTVDRAGVLRFAVPAFAAALRTTPPPPLNLPASHAGVVAAAVGRMGPAASADHPRLAEHVVAAGELVKDEDAARLLLTAAGAYAGVAPGRAVRAYLAALRRLPTDYPGRVRILQTAAVLAWRAADPAGLLALGEPLRATVEAGPGAVPAALADPAAAWGLAALYQQISADADGGEPWRAVRRLPGIAELAELGSRYGIGPALPEQRPGVGARGGAAPQTDQPPDRQADPQSDPPADPQSDPQSDPQAVQQPGAQTEQQPGHQPGHQPDHQAPHQADPDLPAAVAAAVDGLTGGRDPVPTATTARTGAAAPDRGPADDGSTRGIAVAACAEAGADGRADGLSDSLARDPVQGPAPQPGPSPGPVWGTAPALPSPAILRLLATAVSGGDALRAARADLPPGGPGDAALESIRTAAGYGDLAGAFAAVLDNWCQTNWGSVAERYRAMVGAYTAGQWEEALSCARRIEAYVRGPGRPAQCAGPRPRRRDPQHVRGAAAGPGLARPGTRHRGASAGRVGPAGGAVSLGEPGRGVRGRLARCAQGARERSAGGPGTAPGTALPVRRLRGPAGGHPPGRVGTGGAVRRVGLAEGGRGAAAGPLGAAPRSGHRPRGARPGRGAG